MNRLASITSHRAATQNEPPAKAAESPQSLLCEQREGTEGANPRALVTTATPCPSIFSDRNPRAITVDHLTACAGKDGHPAPVAVSFTQTEETHHRTLASEANGVNPPEGPGTDGNKPLMRNRVPMFGASAMSHTDANTFTPESLVAGGDHPASHQSGQGLNGTDGKVHDPTSRTSTGVTLPEGINLTSHREQDVAEWRERCALLQQWQTLQRSGLSGAQAARQLGQPHSKLSTWQAAVGRGGLAALLPRRREVGAKRKFAAATEQTGAEFILPPWFIPAARFFYLLTNRTAIRGSVPESIRRTISLPHVPAGWNKTHIARLLKVLVLEILPECPADLREAILRREREGTTMLPARLMREITAPETVVRQHRNPTDFTLDYLSAPGTMMFEDGRMIRAGDIVEADDATINFPVCVPWPIGGCPCSDKWGVKVGRFQWLVSVDAASRFVTGYSYTMRPRASYRAEDVVGLFRMVARQHGVPRAWRLERGVWESRLVTEAIRNMGSRLITVYSPHQKPFIEGLFNTLWTKLSVHFPDAHVGRFQGEHEAANDLLTACQRGHKDPRRHFPMIDVALRAFDESIAEKSRTHVQSALYGSWIPAERWQEQLASNPLAPLDANTEWMFSPFVREWQVKGMLVGGRVPIFEDLSVPFDFSAPWLPDFHGARVRAYFDPAAPNCAATLVLAQNFGNRQSGEILGTAQQINDVAAYARTFMGWADDATGRGRLARQHAAAAVRREVRAIVPTGRGAALSEARDGIAATTRIERDGTAATPSTAEPARANTPAAPETAPETAALTTERRRANIEAIEQFERSNAALFA